MKNSIGKTLTVPFEKGFEAETLQEELVATIRNKVDFGTEERNLKISSLY